VHKKLWVVLLMFACFNLAGCWDSKDVESLAFPIAAAYDVHQDDPGGMNQLNQGPLEQPEVDVTVIFPNLKATARDPVTVETIPAPTVGYAREKRSYTSSELYVTGFNKVILTGEDLARQGLNKPFESLYRFPEVSTNMLLAVVEGRGEDILKEPNENTDNMATYLYALLREPKAHSIPATTLHEFDMSQAAGRNPVVPVIKAGGVNQVVLTGIAIFKKDRLVTKLNLYQTRYLAFLRGISTQVYIPFVLEDENAQGAALFDNERKVTVERQGDRFTFKVQVILKGVITEHPSEQPVDTARVKMIEDYIAGQVESNCRDMIKTMQNEWKVDCIDINKYALSKWRRELKDRVDDEQFIQNAEIQVETKVKIYSSGEVR
jgi:Ger(x)C family germination protein